MPFDYGTKPPFTLADIRKAIPAQCFEKDATRSLAYLARDVFVVAGLGSAALAIKSPFVWPAYWLAQGTMFWALFVVGHDCGHGSFSNNKTLNSVIGEICSDNVHCVCVCTVGYVRRIARREGGRSLVGSGVSAAPRC